MFSKKILGIVLLVAASAAFVGCTDNSLGFTENQIAYKTNFEAAFGKIDPNQDWNAATRASVTVNVSGESDVQIFTLNGGSYKLVGDYSKVSGTQTLGVDVVKGTEKLLVTNGSTSQVVNLGGNVSFGLGTRTIHAGYFDPDEEPEGYDSNSNALRISRDDSKTKIFTRTEVLEWDEVLPEIASAHMEHKSNGLQCMEDAGLCNLNKVTRDFRYVSTGTFYVYPLYYITEQINTIGLYIKDGDKIKKAPLYTIKADDELQYGVYTWNDVDRDPEDPRNARDLEAREDFIPAVWEDYEDGNSGMKAPAQYREIVWNNQPGGYGFYSEKIVEGKHVIPFDFLKSTPIKVDMPEGMVFGFYLETTEATNTFYSQSELNTDYDYNLKFKDDGIVDAANTTLSGKRACHVATFSHKGKTYVGFEDWTNQYGDSDMDLNDVMLVIDGAKPYVIDEDPQSASWVLACEDLGGSFDGDYNDVVFSVDHISGRDYANVTPLAAGGTLASYLYFGDTQLGEIHSLLGGSTATSGEYSPINVGSSRGSAGHQIRVTVPTNFSMAYCETGSAEFDAINANNMGGFYVKVAPKGSTDDSDLGENSVIAAPELGEVPAIFCIPATYTVDNYPESGKQTEYYWAWAQELNSLIFIDNKYGAGAYPEFGKWVSNHSENTDWYKHPNANGKIVSERKTVRDMEGQKTIITNFTNGFVFSASYFPPTCTSAKITFTHDDSTQRFYVAFLRGEVYSSQIESSKANDEIEHILTDEELTAAKAGNLKLTDYGDGTALSHAVKIVITTK